MQKLKRRKFEEIVGEGIKAIPERFLRKLKNVAIVHFGINEFRVRQAEARRREILRRGS